jgi:hypothetical protein
MNSWPSVDVIHRRNAVAINPNVTESVTHKSLGDQFMKSVNLALISALALAGTAFAQVPSTNDTSDVAHRSPATE